MRTEHLPISSELINENLSPRRKLWKKSTSNISNLVRVTLPLVTGTDCSIRTLKKHIFKKFQKLQLILFDFERHNKKVFKKAFYIYLERT